MEHMLTDEQRQRLSRLAGNGRVLPTQTFADRTRTIAAGFARPVQQIPNQRSRKDNE